MDGAIPELLLACLSKQGHLQRLLKMTFHSLTNQCSFSYQTFCSWPCRWKGGKRQLENGSISLFVFARDIYLTLYQIFSMLFAVLRAPVRFFDTSPTGRILNRFSMDVDSMDERLPRDLLDVLRSVVFTCIAIVLVSLLNFWVAIPAVPIVILVGLLCHYFLRTSRETKRLSLITASPVFSHFVETIQGIETIRSHNKEEDFFTLLCRWASD